MSQMKDTVLKDPSPKVGLCRKISEVFASCMTTKQACSLSFHDLRVRSYLILYSIMQTEVFAPNAGPETAQAEGKPGLNAKAPQIGAALPAQAPKMQGKPAKIMPPFSAMLTSSSQRDTQTRLHSSGVLRGSQEKDEYLLRLLGKGSKPPLPSAAPSPSSGFRVPDPVPHRAAQASNRPFPNSAAELGGTAGLEKGSNPGPGGQTATASGQPTSEVAPGWSYSETQRRIGTDAASSLRATIVSHQVVFLEQLYDLHRAIAVQKLLVRNCPEVKHLMDEAARIVVSSSSGQRDQIAAFAAAAGTGTGTAPAAPPAKRARLENDGLTLAGKGTAALPASMTAALPNPAAAGGAPAAHATAAAALVTDEPMLDDDGEPVLRPDSQFAAVPLPGETAATGDGSGDDGDGSGPNGSGGNGSGGGSNSPQPQLLPVQLLPPRRLLPLQGAPSEASQAPLMFPRANYMVPPWIQPLMPAHMQMQMQMPPGMDSLLGTGNMPPHYHQQYANLAHMQMAAAAAAQLGGGAPNASGSLPQPMATPHTSPAGLTPLGANGAAPAGTPPPTAVAAPAPLSGVPPSPPVVVANPAIPAPGASVQPSSRPPLPPSQAIPAPGGIAASPAAQVAAAGGDPMAWWAQHYYGRQQQQQHAMQMQTASQMGPPQNAQQAQQQMATAGAVTAFGNPTSATYRWWQDPTATFGPPVDLNVVAAGVAAATRKAGNAAGEAESAPPSSAAAAATAVATTTNKQKGSQLVAAPPSARPRRSKRKPSDPIEEASSGTTGQDHHLGPHAVTDDAHFKSRSPHLSRGVAPPAIAAGVIGSGKAGAADTSAAKLLLSFSNKGHVA